MEDPKVETALGRLRGAGHRITTARRAVVRVIATGGGQPTAEEILDQVAQLHPDVHLATVYRTLETLRDVGLVHHTHLRHGPAVYRLADEAREQLVCDRCGSVTEVPSTAFGAAGRDLERDYGFRLGRQHFAITGLCRRCA